MKILLIDDSPDIHSLLNVHVKKEGHDLLCAFGGKEGIDIAKIYNPDLILLDIDMPDMNGYEVCTYLKNDNELSIVPIIFLTGSGSEEEIIHGLDLGATDYVKKPFNRAILSARMRAALRTKHLQDLLINYAKIDPLTELWNRRALEERLNQEWERYTRKEYSHLSFIMLDVDHFKKFNDAYGHLLGDKVLIKVADILKAQVRSYDLATRYGGEEFGIILPNTHIDDAATIAQRCREAIEALNISVENKVIHVTASFGIACANHAEDPKSLIGIADKMLYVAKENGRNCVEMTYEQTSP